MDYAARRRQLREALGVGVGPIIFWGHALQPRNYPANVYQPFRQHSNLLYYFGVDEPGFVGVCWPGGKDTLFGPLCDIDTIVWEGVTTTLDEWGARAGVSETQPMNMLRTALAPVSKELVYITPYQADSVLAMSDTLGLSPQELSEGASEDLRRAVVAQRLVKENSEIAEIEGALSLTRSIMHELMQCCAPTLRESDMAAIIAKRVRGANRDLAFPPIVTIHGEVLHQHHSFHPLLQGRLMLVDMGTESPLGYASDITRTFPVSGRFSAQQRAIYEVVLESQQQAIAAIRPGVPYRDVHLLASRVIVEGLQQEGLMKGDAEAAVAAGAHALFFPHGLGHMMGLDVHDMEDLGDEVGYGASLSRSEQFGLNFLRLAKPLAEGHVVTVEPGVYFIPALIELWRQEKRHHDFICYDKLDAFLDFGGVRIEDDVWVTSNGAQILGEPIAKTVEEVEAQMAMRLAVPTLWLD